MSLGMDAEAIGRLAERYRALTPQERRRYNEANTRKDFIEPLFEALGWNVRDKEEVDAERLVKPGWADYAFLVEGVPRFFLEAKPLADDLYNPEYAKQAITYAYNKGVPWAVLCNFTRFQVFNAEWETDDLNRARFLDLACEGYAQADSPLRLLSREAFLTDELDKRAQTYGGMRPRLPVEKSLYAQMRHWRERLFNEIARMRPELTFEQVDEVIERLLNRLIFIRNCEDRRVDEPMLRAALHQWQQPGRRAGLTEAVHGIFGHFDATFDSDLFALHLVDQLLASGTEFEVTLGDIVTSLYAPPRSLAAYDFSVIDADVLGQVYEQYLGHVAQVVKEVVAKRERQLSLGIEVPQIQLEAKRQRRKERGIYYTPKWVVDYIVRQTVGRYLEEHSYNDILNVKILDPACGSGSFLIRAFDVLLEYHARVKGKALAELDQYERLSILTANIFGVDLDQRAVDIARLNLLLRAVAKRELLPSLERNILRGNSLISGSEGELRPYFGDTWEEKHPLDWQREFPGIMERGGFDIVIGNPPYVPIQTIDKEEKSYFQSGAKYASARGSYDLYVLFVERALDLLRPGGCLGFITSGKFLRTSYGEHLRKVLHKKATILQILDLAGHAVFEGATNYPTILIATKGAREDTFVYVPTEAVTEGIETSEHLASARQAQGELHGRDALIAGFWPPPGAAKYDVIRKLASRSQPLGEGVADIFFGTHTGADDVFVLEPIEEHGRNVLLSSEATGLRHLVEKAVLRPIVKDRRHLRRWHIDESGPYLLFPYREGTNQLIEEAQLAAQYPHAWEYLQHETVKNRLGAFWYGYSNAKNHEMLGSNKPRVITRTLAPYASFAPDVGGELYFLDGAGGGYGIQPREEASLSILFLLGLLNSKALDFYLRQKSSTFRGGWWAYQKEYLKPLPIRSIDRANQQDMRLHASLVALVQRMLGLHERLAARGDLLDEERGQIEREIERTDREIDELVYDLYGLTQEERRLVEEGVRR